jgi:phosphoglycerate dehydrogenase-like enzyme
MICDHARHVRYRVIAPAAGAGHRAADRRRRAGAHGAILVNTARGGLVDEPALVEALRDGHLRAADLDVFAEEPLRADNPLLKLEKVALMPHVAWLTPETLDRSIEVAVENMRRLRDGGELLLRVV